MKRPAKSRRLAHIFSTLALLATLCGAIPASAQDADPTIAEARLQLWPEFDDPGVLVILTGTFDAAAAFPRDVSFTLPAAARNVTAAYPDATGQLLNADMRQDGDRLTFVQLPQPAFRLEYYFDRQPGGNQRAIDYAFVAPFAIKTLEVRVQEPARAAGFSMTPAAESVVTGTADLRNHVFSRGPLAKGDRLNITVRYTKTDTALSQPGLVVTSATTPAAAAPAPSQTATTWLPWALIGAGLVMLAVLLAYWLLGQRRPEPPARPRGARPTPTAARPSAPQPAAFCTQCGAALKTTDKFCSQCGAPRRA